MRLICVQKLDKSFPPNRSDVEDWGPGGCARAIRMKKRKRKKKAGKEMLENVLISYQNFPSSYRSGSLQCLRKEPVVYWLDESDWKAWWVIAIACNQKEMRVGSSRLRAFLLQLASVRRWTLRGADHFFEVSWRFEPRWGWLWYQTLGPRNIELLISSLLSILSFASAVYPCSGEHLVRAEESSEPPFSPKVAEKLGCCYIEKLVTYGLKLCSVLIGITLFCLMKSEKCR